MKRRMGAALAAMLWLIGLCAAAPAGAEGFTVTATFYPLYVAALNIAGEVPGAEVRCLTPPAAGCLHDYQMTAADRRALADSDVIIMNGAGLETFLDKLMGQLAGRAIDASAGVATIADARGEPNPHIWVSLAGMIAQTENIAAGLAAADPAHAAEYARGARAYIEKLSALRDEARETLSPFAGEPIVTFHEAFEYFAADFGLRVAAAIESDEGGAPSAKELAEVAGIIRAEGVRALFAQPAYDDASVDILARETGVPVYLLDTITAGDGGEDGGAYLRMMRGNIQTLAEALQ